MEELTKEQAITDIAENLGISKEYVNFDENKEIYTIKDNNNLKKIHIKKFNCKLYEQYNLSFKKCVFECEIKDTRDLSLDIGNKIFFLKCDFENKIIFSNLYFKNISFILCNFKNETTFQACTFKNFCNFESSVFEHFISFDQSTFLDKVSFYNTYFYKLPHFSRVTFKGDLIATNINLNFDFDELESKIRKGDINFIEYRIKQDEKPLDKFANDFRDSFRVFKNALIKDNNLLDASNFHKCELYCKEIELKQSWNKLKNVTTDEDIKQNNRNYSQLVDFLLLGFYRKLCDHHTDFLRVFNNLILLIALYALFVFGFTWLHDDKLKDTKAILTLFGFFDKFKFYFNIGVAVCMSFGLILLLYKIDKNFIKSFKIFQCLPYIKKWLLKVFKKEIFIKLFSRLKIIILDLCHLMESLVIALLIPCVFYILFAIFGLFLNLDKDFKYLLFVNSLFVSTYICLVYTKSLFLGRYVVLILSYVVFFIMLISQPSIIHPLIGKIMGDFDKNLSYPSLLILNILYTILMALVLFSLQKTARKNSIVPS